MQHVPFKWLKNYHLLLTSLNGLIAGAYVLFNFLHVPRPNFAIFDISLIGAIGAIIQILYALIFFRILWRKNEWIACFISALTTYIIVIILAESTGGDASPFVLLALLVTGGMATLGVYTAFVPLILQGIAIIFLLVGALQSSNSLAFTIAAFGGYVVVSLASWLFFRRHYSRTPDDKSFTALSNMLEQEQFKANVILESITDGVMVINTKGTIQVLNKSAANMLGWHKEQALNLDYKSLIHVEVEGNSKAKEQPALEDVNVIAKCLKTGKSEQKVSLLTTLSNRHIYVDIVASPIQQTVMHPETKQPMRQLIGVIAVLRNVDTQKRQEQQRSDFISTASHEMRTPVASIQGFIELALNPKVCNVDEKAHGYLQKANEATRHLGKLFQDLLTTSRSDDGQLSLNPSVIDMQAFLREVTEQERSQVEKKGLKLVYDEAKTPEDEKRLNPLLYVYADKERLREVAFNLLENAVKYTQAGMVTVGLSLSETSVTLRVSDTGMGVAAEDIPHLFQKFYRTDNSATRAVGGTGLGLYISKQIIDLMGGKIWVESTVGVGNTFYVELPRISSEDVKRIQKQVAAPAAPVTPAAPQKA